MNFAFIPYTDLLILINVNQVYMACRDMKKCEDVRTDIVLTTKNKYVYCRKCDLSSLESIQQFAQSFASQARSQMGPVHF